MTSKGVEAFIGASIGINNSRTTTESDTYLSDVNGDGIIDLFSLPDAAHSVGNYLKGHGWTSSPEAQQKAVFGYNNSTKYVEAVLTLAELTQKQIDSIGRNKP